MGATELRDRFFPLLVTAAIVIAMGTTGTLVVSESVREGSGEVTIVSIEEPSGGKSVVDGSIAPGQPINVTLEYALYGDLEYDVQLVDEDLTSVGSEKLAAETVTGDDGTIELTIESSEITDAIQDDQNRTVNLKARAVKGLDVTASSDTWDIDRRPSTVYLHDVPDAVSADSESTITLYGWSENESVRWELVEDDEIGDPVISSGEASTNGSGYYETTITFVPSDYDSGLGDPPVGIVATLNNSTNRTQEYEIDVEEDQ